MTRRPTHRAVWLLPLGVLLMLSLVIFRELAFTDRILGRGDTFVYFYPYWTARDAFFRAGQLPLWTPDLFMGAPLLANPQLGALYPPNWLTIPLDAPNSIRVAILLHIAWAALGAYLLARRAVGLRADAALVTAATFAFGGYLGAHVEQINQLQGLAWFPWTFLLFHSVLDAPRPVGEGFGVRAVEILLLGGALALQFLAGHTQTVFINGVGLTLYALAAWRPRGVLALVAAGIVALLLASPQLVPTLELISQSGRSGGLTPNAALSFSLNPFIAARGLLPSYDGKIFSEYIAYIGVAGLWLTLVGALASRTPSPGPFPINGEGENKNNSGEVPHRRIWIVIVGVALLLAVGAYNPLNWLVVHVPGFDLFRVPARWLALYALGTAVLAGMGVERIGQMLSRRVFVISTGIIIALFGLSFLAGRVPEEVNGSAIPTLRTLAAWGVVLLAIGGFIWLMRKRTGQAPSLQLSIIGIVFLELIAASWVMPYNDLVPPDVWHAQRFTISQMLVYTETDDNGLTPDGTPPGRLLSISGLFFDPGDKAALSERYQALGMTPLEERYSFVAAKLKETLSPNLPLAWGIPTVDGFGGGLLPTRHYVDFMALAYPDGVAVAVDGRLRENLALEDCRGACVPWDVAGLLDIDYVLVDKVYDVWHEGVAFDTTFTWANTPAEDAMPAYPATTVQVLYTCPDETPDCTLRDDDISLPDGLHLASLPIADESANFSLPDTDATVIGVSLVDERLENQFVQLTPPGWSRVLSSDVKLYESADNHPRAYVGTIPSDDPETIIERAEATAIFNSYGPTRVEIEAQALSDDNILLLQDSYYPGWTATVNETPVTVSRANVNFRAVPLPSGASRVIFEYNPWWLPGVLIFGASAWGGAVLMCIYMLWRRQA